MRVREKQQETRVQSGGAGITCSRKETQHKRSATSSGGCHLRPLHPHAHWQVLEKPRQRSLRANES